MTNGVVIFPVEFFNNGVVFVFSNCQEQVVVKASTSKILQAKTLECVDLIDIVDDKFESYNDFWENSVLLKVSAVNNNSDESSPPVQQETELQLDELLGKEF